MNSLKVALVVPDYSHSWDNDGQFRLSDLKQHCRAGEIDLVVFPESYECVPVAEAQKTVAAWASTLSVPVLMGVESDGFQLAVYHNPQPERDDTYDHVYVKHSTAERLAYEWPDYQGASDAMFRPIRLKGKQLGVQICHDMFYGLIGQRLWRNGAHVLIDL
jgi:predicted amidohydrolase